MIYLTLGIVFFTVALISTCTGRTLSRGGLVRRDKEPGVFWWIVITSYLLGAILFFYSRL